MSAIKYMRQSPGWSCQQTLGWSCPQALGWSCQQTLGWSCLQALGWLCQQTLGWRTAEKPLSDFPPAPNPWKHHSFSLNVAVLSFTPARWPVSIHKRRIREFLGRSSTPTSCPLLFSMYRALYCALASTLKSVTFTSMSIQNNHYIMASSHSCHVIVCVGLGSAC